MTNEFHIYDKLWCNSSYLEHISLDSDFYYSVTPPLNYPSSILLIKVITVLYSITYTHMFFLTRKRKRPQKFFFFTFVAEQISEQL